jgi:release factor glutamine methyltransferase
VIIIEAINMASCILKDSLSPRLDSEVILGYCLKKDRLYIYTNPEGTLTPNDEKRYFDLIKRRAQGEPVQYITGTQEFMGLDFSVKPGVLIPRPDTEILVEKVLEKIKSIKDPIIADVGCGSGAISVSLAVYKKDALIYASDIMDIPLEMTELNSKKNNVDTRVKTIKSDMLKELPHQLKGRLDVIVSNPPYIKESVIPTLMREVRDYEPYSALSGGGDGLYFYREIIKDSLDFLKDDGIIAFEIGYDQGEAVEELLSERGFKDVECIRDLGNRDRVVLGRVKR